MEKLHHSDVGAAGVLEEQVLGLHKDLNSRVKKAYLVADEIRNLGRRPISVGIAGLLDNVKERLATA